MSGGRLVVLDRRGRDVKVYPLAEGLATIGSDPGCDIRFLLPTVSPHHATFVVHANQTVVSSITVGETLVNGVGVSVCALRHGDLLAVGGRTLRWEYDQPTRIPGMMSLPALPGVAGRKRTRSARRPLGEPQRASMPAATSAIGRQVAIVQPQRRQTTCEQNDSMQLSSNTSISRPRSSRHGDVEPAPEGVGDSSNRKSTARPSPKNSSLNDTTKASLWIESRKTPRALPRTVPRALPRSEPRPKKSTPLRLAVLKRAQSAHKMRVTKIQAPSKIDHTKQAAIMLMAGHTPKSKQPSPKQRPSFVVKRPSPVRGKMRGSNISGTSLLGVTPKRASTRAAARASEGSEDAIVLNLQSPILPKPQKSALKKSSAKKNTRKTESIKFDLSNLENPEDRPSDVVIVMDTVNDKSYESASEEDAELRYSDSSRSPSPRRAIHSRSSRSSLILEKSFGNSYVHTPSNWSTSSPSESARLSKSPTRSELESPRQRKSSRGSIIVEKALEISFEESQYSHRTKSFTDQSYSTAVASTRKNITRSPRATSQKLESYSIVDLVSMDSTGSDRSVYGSAGSESSTAPYATPRAGRSTRATNSSLLSSSTPYVDKTQDSNQGVAVRSKRSHSLKASNRSMSSTLSKRSASLTTPENTQPRITINSTRISRASRSRSRINDSDVLLMDDDEASPKSSRRISKSSLASPVPIKTIAVTDTPGTEPNGTSTPEHTYSPEEATTPILSIQNFLEQSSLSQSSLPSQRSQRRRAGVNLKRKTIGGNHSVPKKLRTSIKSRSLMATARRSMRAQKTSLDFSDNSQDLAQDLSQDEDVTTPKSAAKPIQEGVKNKHSSAKKPQSKRSIIDNLDESDFVKQLFNSPVKRKLSRSMTEFSRKKLFEEDDDVRAPTRNTIAIMDRTPDNSIMEHTEAFTPDVFVSPLSTPGNSPNIAGLKRLFPETPDKSAQQSRTRRSTKNDLTDVAGVKQVFARSPRNRLSDVRVKEVFVSAPNNDLRRVTGVKELFCSARKQKSPKNTLQDVRGVKELFKNSVCNDLRDVSGVKSVLRVNSPRNNLSDVRGVRQLYRETVDKNNLSVVSGVDELFREAEDLNTTFDQLIGKPRMRAYTKSKSFTKVVKSKQRRNAKSLHDSISLINENVEAWLQNELNKRAHTDDRKSTSKSNLTRELQKLTTDTIEGNAPLLLSRSRNVTITRKSASEIYSTHTLPIKKRSLVDVTGRSHVQRLPIKKRMVVHSTPVKGRVNITMNASELGRVSPIANVMTIARETDTTTIGLLQGELTKSIRGKNFLTDEDILTTKQLSPLMTNNLSPKIPIPTKLSPKVTGASEIRRKSRASFVIKTKKPGFSPKSNIETPLSPMGNKNIKVNPARNRSARQTQAKDKLTPKITRARKTLASEGQNQIQNGAKKTTRATRRQSQTKATSTTPRKTRAKATTNTLVITKPHTQFKLKTNNKINTQGRKKTRGTPDKETIPDLTIEEKLTRRTRNAKNADVNPLVEKPITVNSQIPAEITIPKVTKQNRRGRKVTSEIVLKPAKEKSASKATVIDIAEAPTSRRKEKTIKVITNVSKTTMALNKTPSIVTVERKTHRGPKSKMVTFEDDSRTNSQSNNVLSGDSSSRMTRGKKSEGAEGPVKKRKNSAKDTVSKISAVDTIKRDNKSKEVVTRGKKTVVDNTIDTTVQRRTRKVQSENKTKKGKNNLQEDEVPETIVRKKSRNAQKSNKTVKEDGKTEVEDVREVDSSRVRRKRIVNEKEVSVKNTKNKVKDVSEVDSSRGKKNRIVTENEIPVENTQKKVEVVREVASSRGRRNRNATEKEVSVESTKNKVKDVREVDSSKGKRKRNVAEKEVPVENTRGRKAVEPAKEATKRGGRTKKIVEEKSTSQEALPEEPTKPVRRKRKVDDDTTIIEAPAKRTRATRAAAALVEPAAVGRSRRR